MAEAVQTQISENEKYNELGENSMQLFEGWIQNYFSKKEDLSNFVRYNGGDFCRLKTKEGDRGYVFAGELQLERDHEEKMMEERRVHEGGLRRKVLNIFIDNVESLSGFYWEVRE